MELRGLRTQNDAPSSWNHAGSSRVAPVVQLSWSVGTSATTKSIHNHLRLRIGVRTTATSVTTLNRKATAAADAIRYCAGPLPRRVKALTCSSESGIGSTLNVARGKEAEISAGDCDFVRRREGLQPLIGAASGEQQDQRQPGYAEEPLDRHQACFPCFPRVFRQTGRRSQCLAAW
jgi:hypothetical protein